MLIGSTVFYSVMRSVQLTNVKFNVYILIFLAYFAVGEVFFQGDFKAMFGLASFVITKRILAKYFFLFQAIFLNVLY